MNKDTSYNVILHHAYGLKLSCFDLGGCQDYWNLLRRPEDGICACGYAKPSTARLIFSGSVYQADVAVRYGLHRKCNGDGCSVSLPLNCPSIANGYRCCTC